MYLVQATKTYRVDRKIIEFELGQNLKEQLDTKELLIFEIIRISNYNIRHTMNYPFFTKVDPFVMQGLSQINNILYKILPMNTSQRRDLPYACKDLSEELTTDRDALSRPYWSSPRFMSAYMHYFLPWNIIRLSRLFPALNFGKNPAEPLIVDLGSGPLTLPIALWLSRKDLRQKPVTIVCTDIAPQPLNLGRTLFEELRKEMDPKSEWKVHTLRTPLFKALKEVRGNPWLITMGNVLNEGEEKKAHPIQKQIDQIVIDAKNILRQDGKIFAVEPGTRQGARVLSLLRQSATQFTPEIEEDYYEDVFGDDEDFEDEANPYTSASQNQNTNENASAYNAHSDDTDNADDEDYEDDDDYDEDDDTPTEAPFIALSPCPHNEECPLSGHSRQGSRSSSAWCHFNSPADYVPSNLRQLSQRAGMDKESISLSFLYLAVRTEGERIIRAEKAHLGDLSDKARVISEAFPIQRFKGRARYACHETGLLLLVDSVPLPTASLCDVIIPQPITKDMKSSATFAIPVPTEQNVSPYLNDYEGYAQFNKSTPYNTPRNNRDGERGADSRNRNDSRSDNRGDNRNRNDRNESRGNNRSDNRNRNDRNESRGDNRNRNDRNESRGDNQNRNDNRNDTRFRDDSRGDNRGDNRNRNDRNESRGDNRSRNDNRNDTRFRDDTRSDNRSDNRNRNDRNDNRSDNRNRNDNRNDTRFRDDTRGDNRSDNRSDNRNRNDRNESRGDNRSPNDNRNERKISYHEQQSRENHREKRR